MAAELLKDTMKAPSVWPWLRAAVTEQCMELVPMDTHTHTHCTGHCAKPALCRFITQTHLGVAVTRKKYTLSRSSSCESDYTLDVRDKASWFFLLI